MLTLLTIVRDEELRIGAMLEDILPFVDLVVLVDQDSRDQTCAVAIAQAKRFDTPILVEPDHPHGYSEPSIQVGCQQIKQGWVLHLDADEFLDPLFKGDLPFLMDSAVNGYWMPRLNFVDGRRVTNPNNPSDCQLRLWRVDRIKTFPSQLHQHIEIDPPVVTLGYPAIIHHKSQAEWDADHRRYQNILQAGYKPDRKESR